MVMSFVVFWIEPSLIKDVLWPGAYLPFVGLLWVTSLITIRLVSGHWGQGLFSGTCLTIVLALRLYQILTWLNLLAILGLWVVVVYYFLGLRATLKESLAKPTAAGADSTDAADQ